jgi:predicted aspartyl protease
VPHVGGLDGKGRPMVRLRVTGAEDELLCMLDTGYSGELWMSEALARQFGFDATNVDAIAATATNELAEVRIYSGEIEWLGAKREVTVQAHRGPASRQPDAEPYALLGTELLQPTLLLVDFPERTILVE